MLASEILPTAVMALLLRSYELIRHLLTATCVKHDVAIQRSVNACTGVEVISMYS
jgi:hypothetical protein